MLELTPEQTIEERNSRLTSFREEFKAIQEKYHFTLKAQISPDGPILSLVDMKYENKTIGE